MYSSSLHSLDMTNFKGYRVGENILRNTVTSARELKPVERHDILSFSFTFFPPSFRHPPLIR
ncbi:hypothetical protein E2C01_084766 [Portunus trituberculatus]|uniref:Uncharacterized protein n=1 Tax=Portunus trituberculatus TaxID=210409 RepID=A0A5B7J739_PORTR|nr:hypothetical protein [Portunus trituberculatus]